MIAGAGLPAAYMSQEPTSSLVNRKWIGVLSEERIGQTWRQSDHDQLIRNLRLADELTVLLLQIPRASVATDKADRTEDVTVLL